MEKREKRSFLWFLEKEEVSGIFSLTDLNKAKLTTISQRHKRKESLSLKEKHKDMLVYLKEGKVEIIKELEIKGELKELTIGILYPGSMWCYSDGLKQKLKQRNSPTFNEPTYSLKFLDHSELLLTNDIENLFLKDEAYLNYLKIFAIQRRRIEKRLEDYIYMNAEARIIRYLLVLLKKRGQQIGDRILLKPTLTHNELGKLTSTTRQLVTSVLNSLRSKQILTFDRNYLLVKDYHTLEAEINFKKNTTSKSKIKSISVSDYIQGETKTLYNPYTNRANPI